MDQPNVTSVASEGDSEPETEFAAAKPTNETDDESVGWKAKAAQHTAGHHQWQCPKLSAEREAEILSTLDDEIAAFRATHRPGVMDADLCARLQLYTEQLRQANANNANTNTEQPKAKPKPKSKMVPVPKQAGNKRSDDDLAYVLMRRHFERNFANFPDRLGTLDCLSAGIKEEAIFKD